MAIVFSTLLLNLCISSPAEITNNGECSIEQVEACRKGDTLVEIEPYGDGIDQTPHQPLLHILA